MLEGASVSLCVVVEVSWSVIVLVLWIMNQAGHWDWLLSFS